MCPRNLPVAMTAGESLLVEVEIVGIAWISGVAGPHLQAGTRVAREDGDRKSLVVGSIDIVGLIKVALRFLNGLLKLWVAGQMAPGRPIGRRDSPRFFDQVSVHEKIIKL